MPDEGNKEEETHDAEVISAESNAADIEEQSVKKSYPTIKNAILLCLLFCGIQLGLGLILGLFIIFSNSTDSSPLIGIMEIISNVACIGIVVWIGFRKTGKSFNEVFKFNNVSLELWIAGFVLTVGLVIVISELDNLFNVILPMPEFFRNFFASMMEDQTMAMAIIYIAVVPAFMEEIFFRGLILDGFAANYSKRKAIIISALLFGLIHLNPWQFFTGFLFGIVLAWVCIETKSIVLCIFMHFFNNALYAVVLRFRDLIPIQGFNAAFESSRFQPWWFTLSGAALTALGIWLVINRVQRNSENSDTVV